MPLGDGRKTVTVAGTAERLSAQSVAIRSVEITALPANTGKIAVGGSTAKATVAAERGTILNAGATKRLDADDQVDDLNQVWVDASVSGEGVSYSYTFEA